MEKDLNRELWTWTTIPTVIERSTDHGCEVRARPRTGLFRRINALAVVIESEEQEVRSKVTSRLSVSGKVICFAAGCTRMKDIGFV